MADSPVALQAGQCPYCGHRFGFQPHQAGAELPCPHCRRLIIAQTPQTSPLTGLELAAIVLMLVGPVVVGFFEFQAAERRAVIGGLPPVESWVDDAFFAGLGLWIVAKLTTLNRTISRSNT